MKHLYEIEARWYVLAEDEVEAQDIRPDSLADVSVFAIEANIVDADWWDAIPYNGDDDKTCGQILQAQKEVEV